MELESGQQKIGEGGRGVVWKALDTPLDRGTSAGTGSNPTIRVGSLSEGPTEGKTIVNATSNAVYADGQRLLVNTRLSEDKPQSVVLVQNWKEGLP